MTAVGFLIVIGCVFGGYIMEGGHIAVLIQPIELLIIGGAALGGLVISTPIPLMKTMFGMVLKAFKGSGVTKDTYIQLLKMLYEIFKTGRGNMVELEKHVDNPAASEIFKKYPVITHNHHLMHFISDTLRTLIGSAVSPYDLEDLLDTDIAAAHAEEHQVPTIVNRVGDAMPGLGIVAAVLGVVITMGKLTMGKEVIGHSVAAALVGTFLGILISYGFMQPLAAKIDIDLAEEGKLLEVTKVALLAFVKDLNPKVCVEFARRSVPPFFRPSYEEVEAATSNVGKAAA